jgi:hypothetical protein
MIKEEKLCSVIVVLHRSITTKQDHFETVEKYAFIHEGVLLLNWKNQRSNLFQWFL